MIIYDALVNQAILDWANPAAIIEYAGKRGGKPSPQQRDISLKLIELARNGKRVLRLKGGDPFVFGRGGEEAQTLVRGGIKLRIIPGISAGIGRLAYAGIPVTHRDVNQSVTFLSGHDRTGAMPSAIDWQAYRADHRSLLCIWRSNICPIFAKNCLMLGAIQTNRLPWLVTPPILI